MLDISFNNLIKEALQLLPPPSSSWSTCLLIAPIDQCPRTLPNPFQVSSHAARTCSWATSPSPIYWLDLQFSLASSSHTNTGTSCPAPSHWVSRQATEEHLSISHLNYIDCRIHGELIPFSLLLLHRHDSFGDSHVRVQRRSHRHRPVPLHPLRTAVPALDLPKPGASINPHNLGHWYAKTIFHLINCTNAKQEAGIPQKEQFRAVGKSL